MKILSQKRCIIGEGPIYGAHDRLLYYTNGYGNEICAYDFRSERMDVLAITTASYRQNTEEDRNAGFTLLQKMPVYGRLPYRFGGKK